MCSALKDCHGSPQSLKLPQPLRFLSEFITTCVKRLRRGSLLAFSDYRLSKSIFLQALSSSPLIKPSTEEETCTSLLGNSSSFFLSDSAASQFRYQYYLDHFVFSPMYFVEKINTK